MKVIFWDIPSNVELTTFGSYNGPLPNSGDLIDLNRADGSGQASMRVETRRFSFSGASLDSVVVGLNFPEEMRVA
jgi:hypothetical protein